LIQALEFQARLCAEHDSPFSAGVLRCIAADVERGGVFADLSAGWADARVRELMYDAVPIRILGGLHFLVLSDTDPELAAQYPAARPASDWEVLGAEISRAGMRH